jgi:stress response protein YsnF
MAADSPFTADGGTIVMPVMREDVHVGVKQVDTGSGVRIHKTVSEQPHHIDQTLLRDAVNVRRVPVDKIVSLTEAPVARQEGDTLIVPILEEILVVEKRLRIKEEIHITRTAQQEPYAETVMLRSEHVSVERFDEAPATEVNSPNGGNHHEAHTRSRI